MAYGQVYEGYNPDDSGGFGGGMGGNPMDSIMQLITGLFSHSGRPYGDAQRGYDSHSGPWSQQGHDASNAFNQRLGEMGNGENFLNNTMAGYQESPFARFQQQQGVRAGNAMGSANGLGGSSALADFMQNKAQDISSRDMQQYYNNRKGINDDYMNGQNTLMGYGHQSDMDAAKFYGDTEFGKSYAQGKDQGNIMNGGAGIAQMIMKLIMQGGM